MALQITISVQGFVKLKVIKFLRGLYYLEVKQLYLFKMKSVEGSKKQLKKLHFDAELFAFELLRKILC